MYLGRRMARPRPWVMSYLAESSSSIQWQEKGTPPVAPRVKPLSAQELAHMMSALPHSHWDLPKSMGWP